MGRQHCRPPGRLGSRREDWAAVPPTAQVSTPLQLERKGRDRGEQGAPGPRSAAPGEEKRLFSAQTPRPGRGRGLGDLGVGLDSGPASTSACEPWSAWPPGLFWGLQAPPKRPWARARCSCLFAFACPYLCLCLAVPELVSTPELSLPDANSPRLPSPFSWQATYPPKATPLRPHLLTP